MQAYNVDIINASKMKQSKKKLPDSRNSRKVVKGDGYQQDHVC